MCGCMWGPPAVGACRPSGLGCGRRRAPPRDSDAQPPHARKRCVSPHAPQHTHTESALHSCALTRATHTCHATARVASLAHYPWKHVQSVASGAERSAAQRSTAQRSTARTRDTCTTETQCTHMHMCRAQSCRFVSRSARPVLGPHVVLLRCVVLQSQRLLLMPAPPGSFLWEHLAPLCLPAAVMAALLALDVDVRFSTDLSARPRRGTFLSWTMSQLPVVTNSGHIEWSYSSWHSAQHAARTSLEESPAFIFMQTVSDPEVDSRLVPSSV